MMKMMNNVFGAGAAALLLTLSGGAAQATTLAASQNGAQDGSKVVLSFSHAGLPAFMPDEKDKAMAEALALFPTRWAEVSRELPGMDPHVASLINTAIVTLARPTRLAIVSNPNNPDGGAFGYGVIASIEVADKADAVRLDAVVNAILSQAELPAPIVESRRFEGMSEFEIPQAGLAAFGPRESDAGWHYEFLIGSVGDPDSYFDAADNPAGFTQVAHMRFDAGGLDPLMQLAPMFAGGNPEAMATINEIKALGITGENAFAIDINVGYTDDESVAYTIVENATNLSKIAQLPQGSLSRENLDIVPADAEFAWVSRGDFAYINKAIEDMRAKGVDVDTGIEQFKAMTGVDPVEDIINALGGTMAMYTSNSTGGGTLLSGVALISFQDRDRFVGAMDRLVELGNLAAAGIDIPITSAAVQLTRWSYEGTDLLSLQFPGLPVPLELTAAMSDEWLILGVTPQAVIAAAKQASGEGGKGLSTNKNLTSVLPRTIMPTSVSYVAPERLIGDGYPYVSMIGSGLANLMRSPTQLDRVAPLLVPLYNDLADGARGQVEFTYWDDDNFVTETHTDRSALVNGTLLAGGLSRILPAILGAGAAIGIAQSQEFGMIDQGQPVELMTGSMFGAAKPIALPQQLAVIVSQYADRTDLVEDLVTAGSER